MLGTGGCACAVGLLRTWDLGLEVDFKWLRIRRGLRLGIIRSMEGFSPFAATREPKSGAPPYQEMVTLFTLIGH